MTMFQYTDPFWQRLHAVWENDRIRAEQHATPWLEFRFNRITAFASELEQVGFESRESGWVYNRLGYVIWSPSPFEKSDGTEIDGILLQGMWAYYTGRGNGSRMLDAFIRAMNRTENGVFAFCVPRPFSHGTNGDVDYTIRDGGLDEQQLKAWYVRHRFQDSEEVSPEGRNILIYESANYVPNPHKYELSASEDKQESKGDVGEDLVAAGPRPCHPPADFADRLNHDRTHAPSF